MIELESFAALAIPIDLNAHKVVSVVNFPMAVGEMTVLLTVLPLPMFPMFLAEMAGDR